MSTSTSAQHPALTTIAPEGFGEQNGMLHIAGVSAQELLNTYGSPLYVLDEQTITNTIQRFHNGLKDYGGNYTLLYACKANCNTSLLKLVHQQGMGLDVVSAGELHTAKHAGVNLDNVLLNGNNKSREELALAIENNIGLISVDCLQELELIFELATQLKKKPKLLIRVTPGIECHTHDYIKTGSVDSKFGVPLKQLPQLLQRIKSDNQQTVILAGLHAHIGSQIFEVLPYQDLANLMFKLYADIKTEYGFEFTHLNLGGGYGIQYTENDDPPDITSTVATVVEQVKQAAKAHHYPLPHLLIEPGRSTVARAGITLYTIGVVKDIEEINKTYVAVDGGMGDNIRPALYGAKYTAVVANKLNDAPTKAVTLAGKYCESGDVLLPNWQVPASTQTGDIVAVFATGAYNYSMSSLYNRVPRPAMVLVSADGSHRLIVKREQLVDLTQYDC